MLASNAELHQGENQVWLLPLKTVNVAPKNASFQRSSSVLKGCNVTTTHFSKAEVTFKHRHFSLNHVPGESLEEKKRRLA